MLLDENLKKKLKNEKKRNRQKCYHNMKHKVKLSHEMLCSEDIITWQGGGITLRCCCNGTVDKILYLWIHFSKQINSF